jgi:ribosomal protein L12E/L44/L45/RPP1/RPP2
MAWTTKGRTQFNLDHLKGVDLEKLIEDYKQKESAANVTAAWEEVNGKYNKPKKPNKPKKKETDSED